MASARWPAGPIPPPRFSSSRVMNMLDGDRPKKWACATLLSGSQNVEGSLRYWLQEGVGVPCDGGARLSKVLEPDNADELASKALPSSSTSEMPIGLRAGTSSSTLPDDSNMSGKPSSTLRPPAISPERSAIESTSSARSPLSCSQAILTVEPALEKSGVLHPHGQQRPTLSNIPLTPLRSSGRLKALQARVPESEAKAPRQSSDRTEDGARVSGESEHSVECSSSRQLDAIQAQGRELNANVRLQSSGRNIDLARGAAESKHVEDCNIVAGTGGQSRDAQTSKRQASAMSSGKVDNAKNEFGVDKKRRISEARTDKSKWLEKQETSTPTAAPTSRPSKPSSAAAPLLGTNSGRPQRCRIPILNRWKNDAVIYDCRDGLFTAAAVVINQEATHSETKAPRESSDRTEDGARVSGESEHSAECSSSRQLAEIQRQGRESKANGKGTEKQTTSTQRPSAAPIGRPSKPSSAAAPLVGTCSGRPQRCRIPIVNRWKNDAVIYDCQGGLLTTTAVVINQKKGVSNFHEKFVISIPSTESRTLIGTGRPSRHSRGILYVMEGKVSVTLKNSATTREETHLLERGSCAKLLCDRRIIVAARKSKKDALLLWVLLDLAEMAHQGKPSS